MKKIDRDPFSNGTQHMMFEEANCDHCIKNSVWDEARDRYTNADEDNMPNRCSILRDIMNRMVSSKPINQRTVDVCDNYILHGVLCPYRKTEWPKRKAKGQSKEQLSLNL